MRKPNQQLAISAALTLLVLGAQSAFSPAVATSPQSAASTSSAASSFTAVADTTALDAAKWRIRNVVQQFGTAWNSSDIGALTNLFTKDGSFVSPTGADAHGRKEIDALLTEEHQQMFRGSTLNTDIESIDLHAEESTAEAVASGTYVLKGVDVALWIEVTVEGTFTFKFTHDSGQWLIKTAKISR